MSRQTIIYIIAALAIFGIGAVVGILGYNASVGGSGEVSQPLTAPTLPPPTQDVGELETQIAQLEATVAGFSPANNQLSTEIAQKNQQIKTLTANQSGAQPTPTLVPTLVSTVTPISPTTIPATPTSVAATAVPANPVTPAAGAPTTFEIVADQSEVRFTVTEDLFGQPTTVIGRTNQVAELIQVDSATPANSRIGGIRINARTLVTDREMRNNAIRARILQSSQDEYEFIDFTPTELSGMPASVKVGDTFTFQITGDLKIRDIVQVVTFEASLTVISETEVKGSAKAQITREQFNLQIPNAPGVANVSNDITLEIDFVAKAAAS